MKMNGFGMEILRWVLNIICDKMTYLFCIGYLLFTPKKNRNTYKKSLVLYARNMLNVIFPRPKSRYCTLTEQAHPGCLKNNWTWFRNKGLFLSLVSKYFCRSTKCRFKDAAYKWQRVQSFLRNGIGWTRFLSFLRLIKIDEGMNYLKMIVLSEAYELLVYFEFWF